MKPDAIITSARVAMFNGRRMSGKQIAQYETAIRQQVTDSRVEVMMLYMAEALHDIAGYGMRRTARILRSVDERMKEIQNPDFNLDDLRVRVFGKTSFVFACTEEEQEYITGVLERAGYHVRQEGGEEKV